MKVLVLTLALSCLLLPSMYSQQVVPAMQYTYDAAGNRISSEHVVQIIRQPDKGQIAKAVVKQPVSATLSSLTVSVAPNPTFGLVNIDFGNQKQGFSVDLSVTDMNGRMVKELKNIGSATTLDLSNQANGVYILRVRSGNEVVDWKIIKQD